jgi:carboxypeptidase C (cathepsin A)
MTEQGPLRPQPDGTLAQNEYAWNKVANYLFIEQPVGVGFSYSTTKSAYNNVGDDEAAELNYNLVVKFFEKFPQYATNEFYISAESYGG